MIGELKLMQVVEEVLQFSIEIIDFLIVSTNSEVMRRLWTSINVWL